MEQAPSRGHGASPQSGLVWAASGAPAAKSGVVLADLADSSCRHAGLISTWALLLAAALPGLEVGP